jgi:ABC-2 type transport system ATP-binding protein
MAPDPGYSLATTADDRALELAQADPRVTVTRDAAAGSGLVVTGVQDAVSAYVASIVRHGIQLLAFTPTRTPLEALFFMLTDTGDAAATGVATDDEGEAA